MKCKYVVRLGHKVKKNIKTTFQFTQASTWITVFMFSFYISPLYPIVWKAIVLNLVKTTRYLGTMYRLYNIQYTYYISPVSFKN